MLSGWLFACTRDAPPPAVRPVLKVAPFVPPDAGPPRPRLPEWTFWEAIDTPIAPVAVAHAPELPLPDAQITRVGGAEARWNAAPAALKELVRKNAFAVVPGAVTSTRVGAL